MASQAKKFHKKGYHLFLNLSKKEFYSFDFQTLNKWFKKNPNILVIAAAKVGGIIASYLQPTEFILEIFFIFNF